MNVPLLNFEGGSGVPLLNLRGSRVPLLKFERDSRSWVPGSRGPGSTFTPCPMSKCDFNNVALQTLVKLHFDVDVLL